MDTDFNDALASMRVQAEQFLKGRYPGAEVNGGAPAVDATRAYALHFEIWASPLRHLRISESAVAVMKGVVSVADEFNRIGVGEALDAPPYDVAVLAAEIGRGLRLRED